MNTKYIVWLVGFMIVGFGVFAGDAYLASTLKEENALNIQKESMSVWGMFNLPKNLLADARMVLDTKVNKEIVDIPVNKLKFFQDQYQRIPNVICDEYNELKLQRNYQMNISTYENTKILQGVKMFDLKFDENPDGNITSTSTTEETPTTTKTTAKKTTTKKTTTKTTK